MKGFIMYSRLSIPTLFFLYILSVSNFLNATLIDRGNGMVYDDLLDVTWLQDAAYPTSHYLAALEWVDALVYGGYDDWRLPAVLASDGPDGLGNIINVTESEVSHLIVQTLGNTADPNPLLGAPSVELKHCGPFLHITYDGCGGEYYDHPWWLAASAEGSGVTYWTFSIWAGEHASRHSTHSGFVWAVRDGDVSVPEPSILVLLAISIVGLSFVGRKQRRA